MKKRTAPIILKLWTGLYKQKAFRKPFRSQVEHGSISNDLVKVDTVNLNSILPWTCRTYSLRFAFEKNLRQFLLVFLFTFESYGFTGLFCTQWLYWAELNTSIYVSTVILTIFYNTIDKSNRCFNLMSSNHPVLLYNLNITELTSK